MNGMRRMGGWLDRHQWAATWGTFLAAAYFVLRAIGIDL